MRTGDGRTGDGSVSLPPVFYGSPVGELAAKLTEGLSEGVT